MLKNLTRLSKGRYKVRNFNSCIDCDFMYLYKIDNGWGACYDRGMTRFTFDTFKEGRKYLLSLASRY